MENDTLCKFAGTVIRSRRSADEVPRFEVDHPFVHTILWKKETTDFKTESIFDTTVIFQGNFKQPMKPIHFDKTEL